MTQTQNWNLYEYRVDFAPQEDRAVVRKGLLKLHRPKLGAYIFDGTVMYTSSKLVQVFIKKKKFQLIFIHLLN